MGQKTEAKRLGRGLSALLADVGAGVDDAPQRRSGDEVQTVPIDRIRPNPAQPRQSFDPEALAELTASISQKGVLQPLIVRPDPDHHGGYQIVAGERRWRAAQKVPLHALPVLVRDFDDQQMLEVAIVENIQRADLNPVDEAIAYRQLIDRFGHTQQEVASSLGKSRSHLANMLRLLSLPQSVLDMVTSGRLSAGHARALVGCDDAVDLAAQVLTGGLSVRQTEALVKANAAPKVAPRHRTRPHKDADTRAIEADLSAQLGLKISIQHGSGGGGELRISYKTLEDLDGLCQLLSR